jgi:hypothetical protein
MAVSNSERGKASRTPRAKMFAFNGSVAVEPDEGKPSSVS